VLSSTCGARGDDRSLAWNSQTEKEDEHAIALDLPEIPLDKVLFVVYVS
jgi:hypothetical protein